MEVLGRIGDWYLNEPSTDIRIYGATKAPHLLPKHVPERLVIREIAYQTILHGFNASLAKDQNKLCPAYPIYIGLYGLTNSKFAKMEAEAMEDSQFGEERFKRHDLGKVVLFHTKCNHHLAIHP